MSLRHGIHDAKIKFMVTMGVVAAYNAVSIDVLTQFLVKLPTDPELDRSTTEKMIAAFDFAFKGVDPGKFDAATTSATRILEEQLPHQRKGQTHGLSNEKHGCLRTILRRLG